MQGRSISIRLRGRGRAVQCVRIARSRQGARDGIGLSIVGVDLVVDCSAHAVVEDVEARPGGDARTAGAVRLRDGDLELTIEAGGIDETVAGGFPPLPSLLEGHESAFQLDAVPPEPGASDRTIVQRDWVPPEPGASDRTIVQRDRVPPTAARRPTPTLRSAGPPRAARRPVHALARSLFGLDPGFADLGTDAPTRFGPMATVAAELGTHGGSPSQSPYRPSDLEARPTSRATRNSTRRRVLLAALLAAATLVVFALRGRRSTGPQTPSQVSPRAPEIALVAAAAAAAAPRAGAGAGAGAPESRAAPTAADRLEAPVRLSPDPLVDRPQSGDTGKTKERAAADALANGSYPEALQLYEQLAAEKDTNPAYAFAVRSIRARLDGGP